MKEQKVIKSELLEGEIEDLKSYIENLKLQIDRYEERIISLQTELLEKKAQEEKEAEEMMLENCRQPSTKDILERDSLERDWQDSLKENKRDILKFMQLKKLTRDITQLEEETGFSPEDIKVLLSTHESLIPEKASILLGIPFNVCEEWPLLAGGSTAILPGGEDL